MLNLEIEKVEKDFINWCQYIHPDVNPYIFLQRYTRYSEEYFPLLDELMVNLHHELSKRFPNVNFSFKGRLKNKRGFLIKSFRTLSENIEKIFPDKYPTDEKELATFLEKRNSYIEKYFRFLLKSNNQDRFNEIKKMIENCPKDLGTLNSFRKVFDQLSKNEKDNLVTRLGRTEDTFANRIIINDVDFNITDIEKSPDGKLGIKDNNHEFVPLNPAIYFSHSQIKEYNGTKYIETNGNKVEISENNLLYPHNLPSSEKNFQNAYKTPDGRLILLQDSIIINENEHIDILDIQTNPLTGDILIQNQDGETRNLNSLLHNNKQLKLRKINKEYTDPLFYKIRQSMIDIYNDNNILLIPSRSKNYKEHPKKDSYYKALHDSFFSSDSGFTVESQIRDFDEEKRCETEKETDVDQSSVGHDTYKKKKLEKWKKNPIMHDILEKDPLAFDGSTECLKNLLYDSNIQLPDLLGKYILVTKMKDGRSISYIPPINVVFEHTFSGTPELIRDHSDKLPRLNFSSYPEFIMSRKSRNDAIDKENTDIPLDY